MHAAAGGSPLDPLGVETPEHVVGDVTKPESVRGALVGCDAVLHAASVYTLDARGGPDAARQLRATELVLRFAQEVGLDPIVHACSHAALLPSAAPLPPNSDIGEPKGTYSQSKAETERIARELQNTDVPVTIAHPEWSGTTRSPLGESA